MDFPNASEILTKIAPLFAGLGHGGWDPDAPISVSQVQFKSVRYLPFAAVSHSVKVQDMEHVQSQTCAQGDR